MKFIIYGVPKTGHPSHNERPGHLSKDVVEDKGNHFWPPGGPVHHGEEVGVTTGG